MCLYTGNKKLRKAITEALEKYQVKDSKTLKVALIEARRKYKNNKLVKRINFLEESYFKEVEEKIARLEFCYKLYGLL